MVIFAQHNMIEDPPFSNITLLSCRNALIYFQQSAQQKVFSSFYFALQKEGFLFLGNSESLGEMSVHFSTVDERTRIFQKVSDARLPLQGKSNNIKQSIYNSSPIISATAVRDSAPRIAANNKFNVILEKLVDYYAPECIVLDDSFDAIHVYGDVSAYTKGLTKGKVSTNIKDMIRNDLSVAVSTALYRCEKNEEDVFYNDVSFEHNGGQCTIDLAVFIVKQSVHNSSPRSYILQFIKHEETTPYKAKPKSITFDPGEQSQQRIHDLEQELIKKQEHLQVTIEELETTNEELQSANEELMSSNEELQSTNEELQSVNEELYTVNSEYQEKIGQLTEANTDLDNVINSIDIGIVFLDENLTIRKYTSHSTNYINVRTGDIGRPIHHISHELEYSEFLAQVGNVSSKGISIEQDVMTKSGQAVLLRMMPYSLNDKSLPNNQAVLITITNISRLRFIENALMQAREQFKSLLKNKAERLKYSIEKNKNVTVLVIDDDSVDRATIGRYLNDSEERSYNVLESSTIEKAMEVINENNIDLCFLDYQLSGNTAEDFSKLLKRKGIYLPIILLSGQKESVMNKEFLSNDVIDYISKDDLSKPVLIRSIDYVMEREEMRNIIQGFEFDS